MKSTYDVRRPQAHLSSGQVHRSRTHSAPQISRSRSRHIHPKGIFGFDSYGGTLAFAAALFSIAVLFVTIQEYESALPAAFSSPTIIVQTEKTSPLIASLAVAKAASKGPLTYLNEEYGFTFTYPSSLPVFTESMNIRSYQGLEPFIALQYGRFSELPVLCGALDCLRSWKEFLTKLDSTRGGVSVNFTRDGTPTRDGIVIAVRGGNALVVKEDTTRDAPPLHPAYTLEFAKGDLWLVLSVHDASIDCGKDCSGVLSGFSFPMKSGDARYAAWNDFVDIVHSFEFLPASTD